ncbi:YchJ family protein [Motiliproteus sp. SC1-56]|uniref:YchJ family protein n=1 Tax=Motiliproteus sp. SC1-56 TaxID=2799565 RepID=UPI001A90AB93|nr:YchJ family protein [Motiliproteus sp. SC1-56]
MLHDQQTTELPCPCGSGKAYAQCCEPAIEGARPADTAEALMRSRYTAFVLERTDYLVETTHPDTRGDLTAEVLREQTAATTWLGLHIDRRRGGSATDDEGEVHFQADFFEEGQLGGLRERSRFRRENGRWFYLDGDVESVPARTQPGRNSPCPCGSGRKFKQCCAP